MKITFGLYLDGQRAWRRRNQLGHAIVGPMGMLTLLETFLGLSKPSVSEGERILQYRGLLEKLDAPDRFYYRSFEVDQYAVARTLLGWRDTWHLHGWNGKFTQAASARLCDMAAIEAHVAGHLVPCVGERLFAIAVALGQRQHQHQHPIESVELVDPLEIFPLRWQEVLQRLPLVPSELPSPNGDSSNLARFQNRLLSAEGEALPWNQEDDSIVVFRSHSLIPAAGLIAELANREAQHTLILAEAEGALFDTLSAAYGNARLGISEKSNLRPSLQFLSLVFSLTWKPLDVFVLLEFLTHPMNPLPEYARNRLAKAVAAQPGIGGKKWCDAMNAIREIAGDQADEVMTTMDQWLQLPTIAADDPAPIALLAEIAARVATIFRSRLKAHDPFVQHASHSGHTQCARMIAALRLLEKQGVQAITRLELDQMFEQVDGNGESSAANLPQVGSPLIATHPAAIREVADTVIWWNMAAPTLPSGYPWHHHEITALRKAGVLLPDMAVVLETEAKYWQRPILSARKQLILVLPPEGKETHPIWFSIERIFADSSIPVQAVEDVLENKLSMILAQPVQSRPLPQRRRWWQFEPGQIPVWKKHSFSSLDRFLNNPFEWVLRYPAQINPPNFLSLPEGNLLLGSLAHRCIELMYTRADAFEWTPDQAVAWVDNRLQQLLSEEGAILLLPGRRTALEAFRQKLNVAVYTLQDHLQVAGIFCVEPEKQISGNFFMGELHGFIDLFVTRRDKTTAVIDMKWSRSKAYQEKLQNNRHLQLAIYSEMLHQQTDGWAIPAYFVLDQSNLYAHDKTFFSKANVASPREQGGSALLWQKALETMRWRQQQFLDGKVELILDDTEADEHSVWPDGALEIESPSLWRSDYAWLAGWGDKA